jgi:hypothetical protein
MMSKDSGLGIRTMCLNMHGKDVKAFVLRLRLRHPEAV